MSEIIKHVGMISNTGKRCAVAFLQIPNKETHALVIDTEALPERIHDPLMGLIRSSEAQQVANLGEVLGRRMMPDTGRTVLEELHALGYLQAQPVENIFLFPRPNAKINLKEMLEAMGRIKEVDTVEAAEVPAEVVDIPNPIVLESNTNVTPEDPIAVATNMLAQAQLMMDDAEALKAKAFQMAPSLDPKNNKPKQTSRTSKPASKPTASGQKQPTGAKVESKNAGTNTKNNSRAKAAT